MKKLFEIPIYAISPDTLERRSNYTINKLKAVCCETNSPAEITNRVIELETYPMRCWDYNHIVGYILISFDISDILFDIYLPYEKIERYKWRSKHKKYMINIQASGTHFYTVNKSTNLEIQTQIVEMLGFVVRDCIPKCFYIDKRAFETLNSNIDYLTIIKN